MKVYSVSASSLSGTYTAGRFVAESKADAIDKARERYRRSNLGYHMNDIAAFRFYITDEQEVGA